VAAAALRRLRFIRSLIADLMDEEEESNIGHNEGEEGDVILNPERPSSNGRLLFGSIGCMQIEEELFEALGYGKICCRHAVKLCALSCKTGFAKH